MTTVYPQWRNQWIPQFYIDQWTVTCFKTMMWYMCSIMFSGTLFTHEWASCLLVPWRLFDDRMSTTSISWWRHQTERFSALLAICAGNSPVPGKFPVQRPVTRSFDVFFDLRLSKRLSKQWRGWWFETHSPPLWRHSNVFIYINGYQERTCMCCIWLHQTVWFNFTKIHFYFLSILKIKVVQVVHIGRFRCLPSYLRLTNSIVDQTGTSTSGSHPWRSRPVNSMVVDGRVRDAL